MSLYLLLCKAMHMALHPSGPILLSCISSCYNRYIQRRLKKLKPWNIPRYFICIINCVKLFAHRKTTRKLELHCNARANDSAPASPIKFPFNWSSSKTQLGFRSNKDKAFNPVNPIPLSRRHKDVNEMFDIKALTVKKNYTSVTLWISLTLGLKKMKRYMRIN